jgi:uncharacterized protein YprB with RNaseH-like and TPR domain
MIDSRDLRDRLELIKKKSSQTGKVKANTETPLLEAGWEKKAPMVFKRKTSHNIRLPEIISDLLQPQSCPASELIFYDTETTGLSGGAGNLVFLAGFGYIDAGRLVIVQLLLTDFPGEPDFLEAVRGFIQPEKVYVSYNGKSFDANILKSRFAMNRMHADFGFQMDLLFPSRRLWKNIYGSCSLSDIERNVLKKSRSLDVPGCMIPDLYFDFIRTGEFRHIEGITAHHLEDIASLVELLSFIEAVAENHSGCEEIDLVGLSSLLSEKPEKAAGVLLDEYRRGSSTAGRELSLMYKRAGNFDQAVPIWKKLWDRDKSIFAAVELAKFLEHRKHELSAALEITEALLALENYRIRPVLPEIQKRRARLIGKINRTGCNRS